ncbi:AraC family transcriptional regulator [Pseudalkalibacillus decolorationis]|uniref:AraC family transcriptional regulator n=1 Tax=Pseudalkalibacillus decolorationis TaxID=163879 RepID=UPI00214854C0|nr:AraC family transcriptional regulator [Pseudalkalibacillus decolorationis]
MHQTLFLNTPDEDQSIPIFLYSIGSHNQTYVNRSVGFSVHQVFLSSSGKGVFRLFGMEEFELGAGEAIVIPAGIPHEYFPASKKPWTLGYVGFGGAASKSLLDSLQFNKPKVFQVRSFSTAWEYIERIWNIVNFNGSDAQWAASSNLYTFLLNLRKLTKSKPEQTKKAGNIFANENIQKVVELIQEHYAEQLQISNLSSIAGYTPQHFTRLFRRIYGQTPRDYLESFRFEKAVFLLEENPEMPIQEVAARVGIEYSYFIRVFKKKYQVTPGTYKKGG